MSEEKASNERLEDVRLEEKDVVDDVLSDPTAEKKLLRKIDRHLIPPLAVLYLLAFLDRTNIGNARIQGLTEDLRQRGNDYNVALFVSTEDIWKQFAVNKDLC